MSEVNEEKEIVRNQQSDAVLSAAQSVSVNAWSSLDSLRSSAPSTAANNLPGLELIDGARKNGSRPDSQSSGSGSGENCHSSGSSSSDRQSNRPGAESPRTAGSPARSLVEPGHDHNSSRPRTAGSGNEELPENGTTREGARRQGTRAADRDSSSNPTQDVNRVRPAAPGDLQPRSEQSNRINQVDNLGRHRRDQPSERRAENELPSAPTAPRQNDSRRGESAPQPGPGLVLEIPIRREEAPAPEARPGAPIRIQGEAPAPEARPGAPIRIQGEAPAPEARPGAPIRIQEAAPPVRPNAPGAGHDGHQPAPAPRPEAPAPRPEAPAPRPEAPAPRPEAPAPRPEAPAPRPEAPAPRPEAPAAPQDVPAQRPEAAVNPNRVVEGPDGARTEYDRATGRPVSMRDAGGNQYRYIWEDGQNSPSRVEMVGPRTGGVPMVFERAGTGDRVISELFDPRNAFWGVDQIANLNNPNPRRNEQGYVVVSGGRAQLGAANGGVGLGAGGVGGSFSLPNQREVGLRVHPDGGLTITQGAEGVNGYWYNRSSSVTMSPNGDSRYVNRIGGNLWTSPSSYAHTVDRGGNFRD